MNPRINSRALPVFLSDTPAKKRTSKVIGAILALTLAFTGLTVATTPTAAIADGANQPFSCAVPTFFVQAGAAANTQLYKGSYNADGTATFAALGALQTTAATNYNALAFNPKDYYLYGVTIAGSIVRIDSAGNVTTVGEASPVLGNAPKTLWDSGTFDPDGNYYVSSANSGNNVIYKITGLDANNPGTRTKTTITLNPTTNIRFADLTYKDGYLWAHSYGAGQTFYRISLTGVVTTITSTVIPVANYGTAFTMENGNLAFLDDLGELYQVAVANPTAAAPTISLVSSVTGTANARSDGSNCISRPADLTVTKTGPDSALVNSEITWTITVTNKTPTDGTITGPSSGWTITDTMPTNVTNISATSNGATCTVGTTSPVKVVCTGGSLAVGASTAITVKATAPSSAGSVVNNVTILGNEADSTPGNNSTAKTTQISANALTLTNDSTTTNYVTAKTISPLANDSYVGGGITAVSTPANGTASFTSTTATYTPNANFSGTDTFTYTVTDGTGQQKTATITVLVSPLAVNDSVETGVNTPITSIPVLTNDKGVSLAVTAVGTSANGTPSLSGGVVSFTPATGFTGTTTFPYTITGAGGATSTATVTVVVKPRASNDSATTPVNTAVTIPVTANDAGSSITIDSKTNGANGTATISGTSIVYTPNTNYSGIDTFTYTIKDSSGQTSNATVTVNVTPKSAADTGSQVTGSSKDYDVIANDTGKNLKVTVTGTVANGTASVVGNQIRFVPADNFSGTQVINYTATDDDGQTTTSTLTITVAPLANNDSYPTTINTTRTIPVLTNDKGQNLSVTSVTQGTHGTVSLSGGVVTFVPETDYTGTGTFSYTITGTGGTSTATVTVPITPTAANDTATTPVNTNVAVDVLANDKGTGLTIVSATAGTHGTVVVENGKVTFTPENNYSGTGTFTYKMKDSSGQEATASVSVAITPTSAVDTATTPVNTNVAVDVLANDKGTTLTLDTVTAGTHGTVAIANGKVTFTPENNYSGTGTFSYTAKDAAGQVTSSTATVKITPVAAVDTATTAAETAVTVDVLANDKGTSLTVTGVSAPTNGTVTIVGGKPVFTPADKFSGTGTFTYEVTDSSNQKTTSTVTVTVTPRAIADSLTTPLNTTATADVVANDLGSGLTITAVAQPAHGALSIANNKITFVPETNYSGIQAVSYTVTDSAGKTAIAVLTLNVTPQANADSYATAVNTARTVPVLSNDKGTDLSVTRIVSSTNGTAVLGTDGVITFTPTTGFTGNGTFVYEIKDGSGQLTTATATIAIQPAAVNDTATTPVNTNVAVDVLANDKGTGLTIVSATAGTRGTVVVENGKVTFTPESNYSGTGTFTYKVKDTSNQESTASVSVAITPTAANDTATTVVNTNVDVDVLANDKGTGLTIVSATAGTHGTVAVSNGKVTFTPEANYSGTGTFTYKAKDSSNQETTASVTVAITPKAFADTATTALNTSVAVDVLANDKGTGLTITGATVGANAHGTVTVENGKVTFTPENNYSGTGTFSYTIKDSSNQVSNSTATVAITPTAAADTLTTPVNVSATADVLANDKGTGLTIDTFGQPAHGSLTLTNGKLVYSTETDYSGVQAITYTAKDASNQPVSAVLTIRVTPLANTDTISTPINTAVVVPVLTNDKGTTVSVTRVFTPTGGTVALGTDGVVTFTPTTGYTGPGTFEYEIKDASGQLTTSSVTVNITPTGAVDTATTVVNTPVAVDVLANDKGTGLTITGATVGANAHGTVKVENGKVTFTPDADYSGTGTFSYTTKDASNQVSGSTGTVTITPKAFADTATTPINTAVAVDVLANDKGTNLTIVDATAGTHGSVTVENGKVTFTPENNYSGTGTFTYRAKDASNQVTTATATVAITPRAFTDEATTPVNTAVAVDVLANDKGTTLTLDTVTAGTRGTVAIANGKVTFTPENNYSGTGTFSYTAKDAAGQVTSSTATVKITPVAAIDTATTPANTNVAVDVLANDKGTTLTIVDATAGTHGTVTVENGKVTFTPENNYSGTGTFTYRAKDSSDQVTSSTVLVTITPTAAADSATTSYQTPVDVNVLSNDKGTNLTVTGATNGTHGTVTFTDSKVVFTPEAGYSGTGTFSYEVTDASGQKTTATGSVKITPIGVDDTASTTTNSAVTVPVFTNDKGTGFTLDTVTNASHGSVAIVDGAAVFTPATNFSGIAGFDYTGKDSSNQPVNAHVTVNVSPLAVNDSDAARSERPVTIAVLGNDKGSGLSLTSVGTPANGTVVVDGNNAVYTSNPNFSGTDTFTYRVTGNDGLFATATVTVTVKPRADDDEIATGVNTPVTVPVLDNDRGASLAVTAVSNPVNGTVALVGGKPVFTPTDGYTGTGSFEYEITGTGGTATAKVTVTIQPKAVDDAATTTTNSAVTIDVLANDKGTGRTISSKTNGSHGTVAIVDGKVVYTPATDFSGMDTFTYEMSDGSGQKTTATVTVDVHPLAVADTGTTNANTKLDVSVLANDKGSNLSLASVANGTNGTVAQDGNTAVFTPAVGFSGTATFTYVVTGRDGLTAEGTATITVLPVARDDSATVVNGSSVSVNVTNNDTGTTLTVKSATNGAHGTVQLVDGKPVYTPDTTFSGTDTFTYIVKDASNKESTATVTVTVAPFAVSDTASTTAQTPVTINVVGNDRGVNTTLTSATNGGHGSVQVVDGKAVYTPEDGFSGTDTFTYLATADGGTSTGTVTVTVAPRARNDSSTTAYNTAVTIDVLANDLGKALKLETATNGTHGTVAVVDGAIVFTPEDGYVGIGTYSYTISGTGGTSQATGTVAIRPLAANDTATTTANTSVSVPVLANDKGDDLTVVAVTNGARGTVEIVDGKPVYTPEDGYSGKDTFTYTNRDVNGNEATATVTVSVTPVTVPDSDTTRAETAVTVTVVPNDIGTNLALTSVKPSTQGGSTEVVDGKVVYTPASNFSGTDTFEYTVTGKDGLSAVGTATIVVSPKAVNDTAAAIAGSPTTVNVVANDRGTDLTVTSSTNGTGGTTAVVDGKVVYTPKPGFSGTDTFTYRVEDKDGNFATGTVTVTVAPLAKDDTASVRNGGTVQIPVRANDLGTGLTIESIDSTSTGTAEIVDGAIAYTSTGNFSGTATITYTVTDAEGQESSATVRVTVAPRAVDDERTTAVNTAVNIPVLANDKGTNLTVTGTSAIANGSATIGDNGTTLDFVPADGFSGVVAFTYAISGNGGTHEATVTVTITPKAVADSASTTTNSPVTVDVVANDLGTDRTLTAVSGGNGEAKIEGNKLVFTPAANTSGISTVSYTFEDADGQEATSTVEIRVSPLAKPDDATVRIGSTATVDVLDNDKGTDLELTDVTDGAHGTVKIVDGKAVYTPNGDFSGTDTFTYTVTGKDGLESTETVTVVVSPKANDDEVDAVAGSPVTVDVLVNDKGTDLSIESVKNGANGTATVVGGKVVYTPKPGFSGTDTVEYTVTDPDGNTSTGTITVTVAPLAKDDTANAVSGLPATIAVGVNDLGSGLELTDVTNGANGTVEIVDGKAVYTSDDDFSGTDAFEYTVTDDEGQETTATVTVTVAPRALKDEASTPVNTAVDIDVLDNDKGKVLKIIGTTGVTNGTATIVDGKIRFVPADDFTGVVTFNYQISGTGGVSSSTVTLSITPGAAADAADTVVGEPVTIDVLANDLGTGRTLTGTTDGGHGSTDISGGKVIYTPEPGYSGKDTFEYTYEDADGQEATGSVEVSVYPVATPNDGTVRIGSTVTIDVIADDKGTDLELTDVTDGAHGTVKIVDGKAVYTPNGDFSGTDTFTYTVTGKDGLESTETVTVVVSPKANDDTADAVAGSPVTVDVLVNDKGTDLSIESVENGANGTATAVGGKVVYTPKPGFSGTDTIEYTVTDPDGNTSTGTITVTVAPLAKDDTADVRAGSDVTIDVTGNDNGSGLEFVEVEDGQNGSTEVVDGKVVYTPNDDFSGTDTFDYTVVDDEGQETTATVTVTVAPRANDDEDSTAINTPVTIDVLDNDKGRGLSITGTTGVTHGVATIVDGKIRFEPTAGFSGVVTFTYTLTGNGGTDTASVVLTITPKGVADTATTEVGAPVTVDVVKNDLGTTPKLTEVANGANGTVEIVDGKAVYTPKPGYSGTDTFGYTFTDADGTEGTATVTVDVLPIASSNSAEVKAGESVTINAVADDEGTDLEVDSTTNGANGKTTVVGGKVVYTPNDGFSGTDTFTYTVVDPDGLTSTATITVKVTPVAGDDTAATGAGKPVTVTVGTNDLGTELTVTDTTNGANGKVTVVDGKPVYTPGDGFSGTDTFTYTVTDKEGQKTTATVTVTVSPGAVDDHADTTADHDVTINVRSNDAGSDLVITGATDGSTGTTEIVDGKIVYSPAPGFSGTDSFTYTVTDGEGRDSTATVSVTINPTAGKDTESTRAGNPVTVAVLPNDVGTDLRVTKVGTPSSGLVEIGDGTVVYTPAAGFSGTATFEYTVADKNGLEAVATVTITVLPKAIDDSVTTVAGTPITITSLPNDLGVGLTVTSVGQGANGKVTIVDGKPVYTPKKGYSGTDTFTYTVTDTTGNTSTATITVIVTPLAVPDATVTKVATPVVIPVTKNDVGLALKPVKATNGNHGSVKIIDDKIMYEPKKGYSGPDTFTYVVVDAEGREAAATVLVVITPNADDDAAITTVGESVKINVLKNDAGTDLTITGTTRPDNGTVKIVDGRLVYTPKDGFSGTDTFTYTAKDEAGTATTAIVTVTVLPTASNDKLTTEADTPVELKPMSNDEGSKLTITDVEKPEHGTISWNGGTATYTPERGFSGVETIEYTVTDAAGQSVTAVITITVTPVANSDEATTQPGSPVELDLLDNDEGENLVITDHTNPDHGTLVIHDDGTATYTPDRGFTGTDTFTYTVTDEDGQTTTTTVTIEVADGNLAFTGADPTVTLLLALSLLLGGFFIVILGRRKREEESQGRHTA